MEEARAEFRNKIDVAINEDKSCQSDAKRDTKESRRERELTYMKM